MTDAHDTTDIPDLAGPYRIGDPSVPEPAQRPMDHKTQPKQKKQGPTPKRQTNGYYADHLTGERLRSVTTILGGGAGKEGLLPWAAYTATDAAITELPALVRASRFPEQLAAMRNHIARAHTRKRDERAEVGGAVHTLIECDLLGLEPPATVVVGEQEWRMDGPELAPFVENFLEFKRIWRPQFRSSEMVVANPSHGYAGTLDFTLAADGPIGFALHRAGYTIDRAIDIMGDTKTGGDWDHITSAGYVHGVYPEAALQEAAYRKAEVCWLPDGTRVPMPPTNEVGIVLHLRPEGFRIYPVRCGDTEYAYFRHVQMVDEWGSRVASAKHPNPVIGAPLQAGPH